MGLKYTKMPRAKIARSSHRGQSPPREFYYLSTTENKTVINLDISNVIKRQNIGNFILSVESLNCIGYNDHASGVIIGCKVIDFEL